jgi:hypothetical protein
MFPPLSDHDRWTDEAIVDKAGSSDRPFFYHKAEIVTTSFGLPPSATIRCRAGAAQPARTSSTRDLKEDAWD